MGLSSMEPNQLRNLKITFIFVIFFWSLLSGLLPIKVPALRNSQSFLGFISAFSGGLFLTICMVHILPEVVEEYDDFIVQKKPDNDAYFPLPYFLVFCGYTMILIMDKVLFDSHKLLGLGHSHGHGDHHDEELIQDQKRVGGNFEPGFNNQDDKAGSEKVVRKSNRSQCNQCEDPAKLNLIEKTQKSMAEMELLEKSQVDSKILSKSMAEKNEEITGHIKAYLSKTDKFSVRMSAALNKTRNPNNQNTLSDEQEHLFVEDGNIKMNQEDSRINSERNGKDLEKQAEEENKDGCCYGCSLQPLVLMIALSFHSIFEGLALGLELNSTVAVDLMISVFIHKFAVGMSLSISLEKAFADNFKLQFWLIFIFSLATPIGVSLGLVLSGISEMVDIVFMSLAGGTFLYVACSEVIIEEFSLPGNKYLKLVAFLFGALVITLLWFLDQ